jgi:predicted DNA-binding transcriptional regulator YafY
MSRAGRLLDLVHLLRRHRRPVSGEVLAGELGVSLRTLYRDIETLKGQGADIVGEAGVGYVLRPGFMLPPLMFTIEELEALLLGAQWVAKRADANLGDAAQNALAKIEAVLPEDLRFAFDSSGLLVGPAKPATAVTIDISLIRAALRRERKLAIAYLDGSGEATRRTVWPVAFGMMEEVDVLAAWCELRSDFRHFRADRIVQLQPLETRMPRRRADLFKEWREREGLAGRAARKLY